MANRYQSAARQEIYETIARYEGEYCLVCFATGSGRRCPPSVKLEIDHAGPERHLVCKTHNLALRPLTLQQHILLMAGYSAENARERIKAGLLISKVRSEVDYSQGSIEMQASKKILDRWLTFVNEWLADNKFISKDTTIYAGAYASGGSPTTLYRHYRTYSSVMGPYKEIMLNGEKVLVLRHANMINGDGNGNGHEPATALRATGPVVPAVVDKEN